MSPPDLKNDTIPYKLYNMGGVLLNIISILIVVLIKLIIPIQNDILIFILNAIILFGMYFALNNGIPRETNLVTNDGANTIILLKEKDAIKAFWAQLKMIEAQAKNIRIKDMPNEWFEINNKTDNQMINTIKVLKCNKLLDEHKFELAKNKIEELLNQNYSIINLHKNLLIIDKIYCELYLSNFEEAEKLMTKNIKRFMNLMKTNPSIIRTNYAYTLLKEKNNLEAQKILKTFEKIAKTYPYSCEIKSEKELIELLNI